MKTHIVKSILFASLFFLNTGCNEDEFLNEVPLDFYSPENSYITESHFEAALVDLYARVRELHSVDANANQYIEVLGTDVAFNGREDNSRIGNYNNSIIPQGSIPSYHWVNWYKIISNANTIIARIPDSEVPEAKKTTISAEARLFRAWAYRHLVYLYGGVPLVLNEVSSPKKDFLRASRQEVLDQIISDAKEAAEALPNVDAVTDGRLNKSVANHLLAETYITLKNYDLAISAATEVIERSNLKLMTERFGSLRNSPGDVFYDLFRVGNQNRRQGNMEAIWVAQYELDVIGGALTSAGSGINQLERVLGPVPSSIVDPSGKGATYAGLGASTLNCGGRAVSFVRSTDYFLYDIWGLDPKADNRLVTVSDIRTSPYNIVRDFKYSNPDSEYFGKSLIDFPASNWIAQRWRWYPYSSKGTTPGQHPEGLIDNPTHLSLKTTAGATYRDMYLIRLPETLLLRAEAYLMKGDVSNAAADINVVRGRANAVPVSPVDVSLNFILDERARELTYEENRRLTLQRLGLLVERVRKYNPLNSKNINDHNELFPIPYAEIEANKDAVLEQNPGYN